MRSASELITEAHGGDFRRHDSNKNFIKYAQGADVVIHEVGAARPELLERDTGVRQMLATHHSSPEEAARDSARIKPKLAVYTHFTRPRRDDIAQVSI